MTAVTASAPTILIVDESEATRDLYQRVLGSVYQITCCASVHEAFDVLQTRPVRMLILEPNAPHNGGWDLLANLRTDTQTRTLPVILCSTLDERRRAVGMRVDAYLVKPVLPTVLLDTIRRLLPISR